MTSKKSITKATRTDSFTALCAALTQDHAHFAEKLALNAPIGKDELHQLLPGARFAEEFLQGAASTWTRFGAKTGMIRFAPEVIIDAIREVNAMASLATAMRETAKLFDEKLFRIYAEAGLEADAMRKQLRITVKRPGGASLKPALKELEDFSKLKRKAEKALPGEAKAVRAERKAKKEKKKSATSAASAKKVTERVTETTTEVSGDASKKA